MSDFESILPLGKASPYKAEYDPRLLCPFPRKVKRDEIGIGGILPFSGYDIWNGFELSWLNGKGKPVVAIGEFHFPCESPNLIESKSFKLYLNSYNQTCFHDLLQVQQQMAVELFFHEQIGVYSTLQKSCVKRIFTDLDIEIVDALTR